MTHTQSLRGLSPNHVLVLVNGKRRHETANLNISGGLEKGSTGVDLDTIPINAIERVEVLRDGASAQYGSDAIAGVINVILKSADSGGSAAADVGQTGDGDGFTHGGGGNIGLAFGDSGFVNLTAEYREQERTMRSGIDERTGRRDNISMGDPALHRQSLALNSGFGLGDDIEVYGFGTYTRRKASSAANYRLASVAPTLYPDGFTPRPNSDEDDYAFLAGVRGERLLDAWHWDLSSGYGADRPDIGMTQSVNAAIYRETGNSPRSFDLARYRNSQWTSNLDLGREFELDFLAAPLALSLGAEYRRESYRIDAGDPASYYSGGAESLAGLSPLSEGQWSRHAWASYLDLGTSLTPAWEVDVAVRHEKFSDFGSTTNGKFATRYQFDPRVALRASVSSGFRAPSLVQEHYTGLSVGPTIALGLLAANSPAAKMLGADELQPEKSTSFNLGLVLSPWENVGLNIDAYQISIRDRIVDSATYSGQEAIDALAAAGISLPASASTVSTHYLANGADTRTRGVDITGHYLVALGEYGQVDWELGGQLQPHHLAQEPSRRQRRAAAQCPAGRLDHQLHPAQPGFPRRHLEPPGLGGQPAPDALRPDQLGTRLHGRAGRLVDGEIQPFRQRPEVHHRHRRALPAQRRPDADRRRRQPVRRPSGQAARAEHHLWRRAALRHLCLADRLQRRLLLPTRGIPLLEGQAWRNENFPRPAAACCWRRWWRSCSGPPASC